MGRLREGGLTDTSGFRAWTLENVLAAFGSAGAGPWCNELRARYLGV